MDKELGPEDCAVCGNNRSICLDTACPYPTPYGRLPDDYDGPSIKFGSAE